MTSVEKGTVVRVLGPGNSAHYFKEGLIVTATGEDFGRHPLGNWSNFEDEEGNTQFLLPYHYEVVAYPEVGEAPLDKTPTIVDSVDEDLPTKVIYVIVNSEEEIYATTADRDFAREMKAGLGGKRKGFRIFQYAAVKEIR